MNYTTSYNGTTLTIPTFNGTNHTFYLNFTPASNPFLFYQCMVEVDFSFIVYNAYTGGVASVVPNQAMRSTSVYLLTVNQKGIAYFKALSCNSCSNTYTLGQSASDILTASKPTSQTFIVDQNHSYIPVTFSSSYNSPTIISVVFGTPNYTQSYSSGSWIGQLSTSCRILSGTHGTSSSSFTTTENSLDSPYFTFIN